MNKARIPVLMYHSVGLVNRKWLWKFLTIPFATFQDHIKFICQNFATIHLDELYNYVANGNPIKKNALVLTFDDGYLDNWVFLYPLLKKYGIKATIFVTPEFVDPCGTKRPNLENVWSKEIKYGELISNGFMSWQELREMENSGLVKIESHAMTHTWYFSGNRVVDFRHPGDEYVWMDWNNRPNKKYLYINTQWKPEPEFGAPVYEHKKSLQTRRIFPDKKLKNVLTNYVDEKGGALFFNNAKWKTELFDIVKEHTGTIRAKFITEKDIEFKRRLYYEIVDSKNTIENKLNKQVKFFCWPGGGICEEAIEIAKSNYTAVTMPSSMRIAKSNCYGEDPFFINRIGAPNVNIEGKTHYFNGHYLYYTIKEYQGSYIHRRIRQALKIYNIMRMKVME